MPLRYRIDRYGLPYQYGSCIAIDKEKVTIKLDSGEIVTDPPIYAQYIGSISDRQLKSILNEAIKTITQQKGG